jgi:hypothetical protein
MHYAQTYRRSVALTALLLLLPVVLNATIRINEILASNATINTDPDYGNEADWVELHNDGTLAVNLNGYYVTDNLKEPTKWLIATDLILQPGGYALIWCDDNATGLHTAFKLSASGEAFGLYSPDLIPLDTLQFGPQFTDVSYGRNPTNPDSWAFYTLPTPGAANGTTGFAGQVAHSPAFSVRGGIYTQPFSLMLGTNQGGLIRYTLDGSTPTEESPAYSQPLWIDSTTVVRASVFQPGYIAGPIQTHSYFMGQDFTSGQLPLVSIVTDSLHFWGAERGIYVQDFKPEWEIPVNIELFENNGSNRAAFNERAGIKVNGLYSWQLPQKMLGVYFRKQYGSNQLDYPLFFDRSRSTFDNFALRASGSDWSYTLFRDGLIQQACHQYNMDLENMAFRPAVVYVNGQYMGIHNIREKVDEDYIASNHGVEEGTFDLIENGDYVESGNLEAWNHYWRLVKKDLSIQANYDSVAAYMDIENFTDLIATEVYAGNSSIDHNTMAWKPKDGGKWRWILMDLDRGFVEYDKYMLSFYAGQWVWPLADLLKNKTYQTHMGTRLADHLYTTYNPGRMVPRIYQHAADIEAEMPRHIARWLGRTSSYGNALPSLAYWRTEVADLVTFAESRPMVILQDLQQYGFGLPASLLLDTWPAGAGRWRFNGLQVEGQLPTGSAMEGAAVEASAWLGQYPTLAPITVEAKPKPGHRFVGWAATTREVLIAKAATWSYLDNGSDQGQAWTATDFDDSAWKTGQGILGYGYSGVGTSVSYGGSSSNKYITTYFRQSFTLDENSLNKGQFILSLLRDDGAVVYLNGHPIIRTNMPDGSINYKTKASTAINNSAETTYTTYAVDKSLLHAGVNTLAVEVHQNAASSSDLLFDLELTVLKADVTNLVSTSPTLTLQLTEDKRLTAVYQTESVSILSDTLPAGTVLTKTGSPYLVSGDLVVPAHTTLRIEPGVVVNMPAKTSIRVHGAIEALGTVSDSITFQLLPTETEANHWGALFFLHTTDTTRMRYVTVKQASKGPGLYNAVAALSAFDADLVLDHMNLTDNEANPLSARYSSIKITNSRLHSKVLGDLINVKYGHGYIENCRFTGNDYPDTDGIDYDEVTDGVIRNVVIHDFMGSNSDAIDIGEAALNVQIDSVLLYNITDKGVSVGQQSIVRLSNATMINTNLGVAAKDSSWIYVSHSTFYGVGTPIASYEKNVGHAGGNITVNHSLMSNSYDATLLVDDKSTLLITDSQSDNDTLSTVLNNQTGTIGFPAPGLYNLGLGTASFNSKGSNFFPEQPAPTPVISALYVNSTKIDSRTEFIELSNPSTMTLDLGGYQLSKGVTYTFPAGTLLKGGHSLLLVKNRFTHLEWLTNPSIHEWSEGSLANEGETVRLNNPWGMVVDQVIYGFGAPWPSVDNLDEKGLKLLGLERDNHLAANWTTVSYSSLTGLSTTNEHGRPTLYPNPCQGPVTVYLPDGSTSRLDIYDLSGRLRFSQQVTHGNTLTLNLPSGLYLAKLGEQLIKLMVN